MGLILKIAAGIIIGLLVVQIFLFNRIDTDYIETRDTMLHLQDLKNKHIILTNAIHSYYKRNRKLPTFISDLSCRDIMGSYEEIPCATLVDNGVFYVNQGKDWASAEPYVVDNKVFNKCRTTQSFGDLDESFRGCLVMDVASIPERTTPVFDCKTTSDTAEKLICSSDRLIATDAKLTAAYNKILTRSADDKKQEVLDDQVSFNKQRSKKCQTEECIKTMTEAKITRLELLGIRSPK